jgi:hypothetical protein
MTERQNAQDVTPDTEYNKIFLTGDYGTGKSAFAQSCPTPGYVFDFDDRIMSYRNKDFDYDTFSLSAAGWAEFEKVLREVKKDVEDKKYETVVVDSTTTMTDIAMERALQLDPKRSATGGPIWNVHYMMVRNLMEGKLRQIINFHCNVIVIAHLNIVQDQETGAVLGVEPLLTGQLSQMIPGYFGEVYLSFTRQVAPKKQGDKPETVYYLRTVPRGHYKARSVLSGIERLLPDELPNNYNALVSAYKESINKKGGEKK